jgi:hypothetical protein
MQVRATAVILKAYKEGNRPPAITIASLSVSSKLPDLDDLREVLNMQHLVRSLEYKYFTSPPVHHHSIETMFDNIHPESYRTQRQKLRGKFSHGPEFPNSENATIDSFRDSFYRAMYRLFLAGAMLARPYMEPLFHGREEGGKSSLHLRFGHDQYSSEDTDYSLDNRPTKAELAYFRQFPVYNFDVFDWSETGKWRDREYETCFGPFASWIVEDGRMRERDKSQDWTPSQPEWAENSADVGAVRELMLLLVAYDQSNTLFSHQDCVPESYLQNPGHRTVSIIRLNSFQVDQVVLPAAFEDARLGNIYHRFHPALEGTKGEDISYQFCVTFATWVLDQKRRNYIFNEVYPEPHPVFDLWHFALRRYLNLGFKSKTFQEPRAWTPEYGESIWDKEVITAEIFYNPYWACVQKYEPGMVSWRPEDQ